MESNETRPLNKDRKDEIRLLREKLRKELSEVSRLNSDKEYYKAYKKLRDAYASGFPSNDEQLLDVEGNSISALELYQQVRQNFLSQLNDELCTLKTLADKLMIDQPETANSLFIEAKEKLRDPILTEDDKKVLEINTAQVLVAITNLSPLIKSKEELISCLKQEILEDRIKLLKQYLSNKQTYSLQALKFLSRAYLENTIGDLVSEIRNLRPTIEQTERDPNRE